MSNTLDTLVRLKKFELDEKRRALKELQDQEDATNAAINQLEQDKISEALKAKEDHNLLQAYGNFAAMVKQKITGFEAFLAELAPKLDAARDDLAEQFAEFKKVEISRDNRRAEDLAKQNRKETIEADERGMQGHRRSQINKP